MQRRIKQRRETDAAIRAWAAARDQQVLTAHSAAAGRAVSNRPCDSLSESLVGRSDHLLTLAVFLDLNLESGNGVLQLGNRVGVRRGLKPSIKQLGHRSGERESAGCGVGVGRFLDVVWDSGVNRLAHSLRCLSDTIAYCKQSDCMRTRLNVPVDCYMTTPCFGGVIALATTRGRQCDQAARPVSEKDRRGGGWSRLRAASVGRPFSAV